MTRSAKLAFCIVFALLIAAVVWPRLSARRAADKQAQAAAEVVTSGPQRVAVVAHTVQSARLVESLSTTGALLANEQVDVVSEIAGHVAELKFREGAVVAAGDVLVELDRTELGAQRDRAAHRVELARRREARQRQLLDDGLISPQDYDFVRTDLDVLESELALVEAQLSKTKVLAPFSGVVGLRFVSPGAYVTPQTRIASLQDLDPMKVDFSVPERYAARIGAGQKVEVRVAGFDDRFTAEIYAIEPEVDAATRSLLVRARLPNSLGRLRPGAFAEVEVIIAEVPAALTVPATAIIPELGGKKVFVVENGAAVARKIETGIRTDTEVEVTSGLEAGDSVIVRGLERVSSGTPVETLAGGSAPAGD